MIYHILLRRITELDLDLTVRKTLIQIIHQQLDDAANVILGQRLKENDLIQTVLKLRTEVSFHFIHDSFLAFRKDRAIRADSLKQLL